MQWPASPSFRKPVCRQTGTAAGQATTLTLWTKLYIIHHAPVLTQVAQSLALGRRRRHRRHAHSVSFMCSGSRSFTGTFERVRGSGFAWAQVSLWHDDDDTEGTHATQRRLYGWVVVLVCRSERMQVILWQIPVVLTHHFFDKAIKLLF